MTTENWRYVEPQSSLELGFSWDGSFFEPHVARHTRHKVVSLFRRELPEHVYDALRRVFNPMSYTEVKTMCDGASVGGVILSDFEDALYLTKAHQFTLAQLQKWDFKPAKDTFKRLNEILAFDAQEAGKFSSESDEDQFDAGMKILARHPPLDRAILFFAFARINKFFKKANDFTAFLMMNTILMSNDLVPIRVDYKEDCDFDSCVDHLEKNLDASMLVDFLMSAYAQNAKKFEPPL